MCMDQDGWVTRARLTMSVELSARCLHIHIAWTHLLILCLASTTPTCPYAQPAHHLFFPSADRPKVGCLRSQPSHILLSAFATPTCAFAQPEHHHFFPSADSPKLALFSSQPSYCLFA